MAGIFGVQTPMTFLFVQGAAGAAANNFSISRGGTLVDVTVIARADQVGGTVTVGKGADAVTDAIVCATDGNVTRAGTINDSRYTFVSGDALRVTTAGAATLCTVAITLVPPMIDPNTI